ncbi:MAG: hypothetical protein ACFCU7_12025 [Pleurocapsa sp.]
MTLDTSFDLFGVGLESDPLTGVKINSGVVGVEVNPDGSTSVGTSDSELVGVDLTQGVAVDISGSEFVGVDLTQGVVVDVAEEVVGVDLAEGVASVEVAGLPVEVDLTQGVLVGVGEELLFADLIEGVVINTDILAESGIVLPTAIDI